MTTMTGDCGRCDGKGEIRAFRHIAGGVCYACKGTGRLTIKVSNMVTCASVSPVGKAVSLPTLGDARVARSANGLELRSVNNNGEMVSYFRVVAGRIVIDGACNGHLAVYRRESALRAELQAAYAR